MNKPEIYEFLNHKNIPYRAYEHEAVFTVEAANALNLLDPECGAKNLFLRDDLMQVIHEHGNNAEYLSFE